MPARVLPPGRGRSAPSTEPRRLQRACAPPQGGPRHADPRPARDPRPSPVPPPDAGAVRRPSSLPPPFCTAKARRHFVSEAPLSAPPARSSQQPPNRVAGLYTPQPHKAWRCAAAPRRAEAQTRPPDIGDVVPTMPTPTSLPPPSPRQTAARPARRRALTGVRNCRNHTALQSLSATNAAAGGAAAYILPRPVPPSS